MSTNLNQQTQLPADCPSRCGHILDTKKTAYQFTLISIELSNGNIQYVLAARTLHTCCTEHLDPTCGTVTQKHISTASYR